MKPAVIISLIFLSLACYSQSELTAPVSKFMISTNLRASPEYISPVILGGMDISVPFRKADTLLCKTELTPCIIIGTVFNCSTDSGYVYQYQPNASIRYFDIYFAATTGQSSPAFGVVWPTRETDPEYKPVSVFLDRDKNVIPVQYVRYALIKKN